MDAQRPSVAARILQRLRSFLKKGRHGPVSCLAYSPQLRRYVRISSVDFTEQLLAEMPVARNDKGELILYQGAPILYADKLSPEKEAEMSEKLTTLFGKVAVFKTGKQ